MSTVIKVEGMSKRYKLGHETKSYETFREHFSNFFLKPKTYRPQEEFWALKDISFKIDQGDRVGIVGRNGAGKSTLLKILSRITDPTIGKASLKGRVASLLEVGTGFHPELTGRENIFLNGAILGMSRFEIKKKFDEIVDFAEVEKFLDTPVKRYSSGMYVKLAFSVAAHLEPEILIIDEVLAVGDAQFQKKCLGRMESVSKNGRTILFVSHNVAALSAICNKGILLQRGALVAEGAMLDIITKYNLDSRNFLEKNQLLASACSRFHLKFPYFVDDLHRSVKSYAFGSRCHLVFDFFFKEKLPRVNPGIAIFTKTGERLVTFHYADSVEYEKNSELIGPITLVCSFDLIDLAPGNYEVGFGVRNEFEENSIYDPSCLISLEVTSEGVGIRNGAAGLLFRSGRWKKV